MQENSNEKGFLPHLLLGHEQLPLDGNDEVKLSNLEIHKIADYHHHDASVSQLENRTGVPYYDSGAHQGWWNWKNDTEMVSPNGAVKKVRNHDGAAQSRVKRLRARAREESRDMLYQQIHRENELLKGRLQGILNGRSELAKMGKLGQMHQRVMKGKVRAQREYRSQKRDVIKTDNQRMSKRISQASSEYNYLEQAKKKASEEKKCQNYRQQSLVLTDGKRSSRQRFLDDLEKHAKRFREKASHANQPVSLPKKKTYSKPPGKLAKEVQEKVKNGMYQEPVEKLCIFQAGTVIDGARVLVSFHESTKESPTLEIRAYNQGTSQTEVLRVNKNEIRAFLGPAFAQELFQESDRKAICKALMENLRFFSLNGNHRLVLTSYQSFGMRQSTLLAEKRAMNCKLGRLSVCIDKTLPRETEEVFEKSVEIDRTETFLRTLANAKGDPFPQYALVKKAGKVIPAARPGNNKVIDLKTQTNRFEPLLVVEPEEKQSHQPELFSNEPATSNATFTQQVTAMKLIFQIHILQHHEIQIKACELDSSSSDPEWIDCTGVLRPNVKLTIAMDCIKLGQCSQQALLLIQTDLHRFIN